MPDQTSGDVKNKSLPSKKSLGNAGRPETPSKFKKLSKSLLAIESRESKELPTHRLLLRC